jgi:hypothetical protein
VELINVYLEHYKLGASYCRECHEKGGVAICIHNRLKFLNINVDKYCEEQDTEICALQISFSNLNIYVLTVYRAPSGNS